MPLHSFIWYCLFEEKEHLVIASVNWFIMEVNFNKLKACSRLASHCCLLVYPQYIAQHLNHLSFSFFLYYLLSKLLRAGGVFPIQSSANARIALIHSWASYMHNYGIKIQEKGPHRTQPSGSVCAYSFHKQATLKIYY